MIEVTVCYHLYLQLARKGKIEKYTPLFNVLVQLGYNEKLNVLCFGSLGNITKECITRKICRDRSKEMVKWCSIFGETELKSYLCNE